MAAMRITRKFVKTINKCILQHYRLLPMAAMSIPSISTYNNTSLLPSTKISSKKLLSRHDFITTMSISNYNTNAYEEKKKDGHRDTAGEITSKAVEENVRNLGLDTWFMALKLHEKGGDPRKVIEYCKKAIEIMEDYKKRGVTAPVGLVHGWPFVIAFVNLLLGSVYHNLKKHDHVGEHLYEAENILEELTQDESVLQILLETQREQFKHEIMCADEDNVASTYMCSILQNKEKMMGEDTIELGEANKDTCVAYLADLDYEAALPFALKALEIYTQRLGDTSVAVAQLRGILGLIYSQLGKNKKACEQNQLSLGILENMTHTTCGLVKGSFDRSDRLISLDRFEEAIEVLWSLVSNPELKGGDRAIALVSMARAFSYQSKFADAMEYIETACQILEEDEMPMTYKIVGFWVMSALYERMSEYETATSLLRRVLIMPKLPMQIFVQGSETLCSLMSQTGGYKKNEILGLRECVVMLKNTLGHKIYEAGYGYGPLAIVYMESGRTASAVMFMEYAKQVKDFSAAPYYKDLLQATQSLSVAYASIGSYDLAIALQEKAVESLALEGLEPSITKKLDLAVGLLNQFKEMAGDSQ